MTAINFTRFGEESKIQNESSFLSFGSYFKIAPLFPELTEGEIKTLILYCTGAKVDAIADVKGVTSNAIFNELRRSRQKLNRDSNSGLSSLYSARLITTLFVNVI